MRRSLAILAALIAFAAAPAAAREPLDFDLPLLGAPSPGVWQAVAPSLGDAEAKALAGESRARFGRLANDLALAFSSSLMQPASTTGQTGFAFGVEGVTTGVSPGLVGATEYPVGGGGAFPRSSWPSRSVQPHDLLTTSVHVRKAFPFSLELGGRVTYLSQSSYFAAQIEGKWAVIEGYSLWPDAAVRVAWTKLLGQADLDLATTELDLMASKRFGVNAVTSLTPYLAMRFTRVNASTRVLSFWPDESGTPATPAQIAAGSAAFPSVASLLYRTTAGVRFTSFAVFLNAEVTYYGGGTQGKKAPGAGDYPQYYVPSSLSGGLKFGFEF